MHKSRVLEHDMTNQTILSLLDYLCNEARNSVHASFGLMALRAESGTDPSWQSCLDTSKSSAERLLRSIDDLRELFSPDVPAADLPEEFDITLCLGETIEVLNLASADHASRLVLQKPAAPLVGRQDRHGIEQVFTRVLRTVSKLSPRGEARVAVSALSPAQSLAAGLDAGGGVRIEIVPHNSNIALRVSDWLNADPEDVNFKDADDVLFGVDTLVAGKRIRALGGNAEFQCDARSPMGLSITLPWCADGSPERYAQTPENDGWA